MVPGRSATVIRAGKKREFVDPSIAIAVLGLTPDALQLDLKTFGFLFECLCIRDLKIYSQALGGRISYYHDRYGLEADAVLHLDNGKYALIEFKLGSREIEEGAAHLLQLKELIRKYNTMEQARFYMEHLGADFSDYLREDKNYREAVEKAAAAAETAAGTNTARPPPLRHRRHRRGSLLTAAFMPTRTFPIRRWRRLTAATQAEPPNL